MNTIEPDGRGRHRLTWARSPAPPGPAAPRLRRGLGAGGERGAGPGRRGGIAGGPPWVPPARVHRAGTRKAAERALEPSGERGQPGAGGGGPPAAPCPAASSTAGPANSPGVREPRLCHPLGNRKLFRAASRLLARSRALPVCPSVCLSRFPQPMPPPPSFCRAPALRSPRGPLPAGGDPAARAERGGPEPRRGLGATQSRRGHVPAAGGRGGSPCLLPAGSAAGPGGPVR